MDYPLSLNRCLFSLFDFISGSSSWFCCCPVFSFFCFPQPLPPTGLLPSGPMSYRTFLNSTLHCPAACKNWKSKCEQQRKYFVLYKSSTVPRDENMKSKSYRTLSPAQSGSKRSVLYILFTVPVGRKKTWKVRFQIDPRMLLHFFFSDIVW